MQEQRKLAGYETSNVAVSWGMLLYLSSLGLLAAASIALFALASVSMFPDGVARFRLSGTQVPDREAIKKLQGIYPQSASMQSTSPSLIKAKNLLPTMSPSYYPKTEVLNADEVFTLGSNRSTSGNEVGEQPTPANVLSVDEAVIPQKGEFGRTAAGPFPISDDSPAAPRETSATPPSAWIPDGETEQIFRQFTLRQERTAGLNEYHSASPEINPTARTRTGTVDSPAPGPTSSFRYRVARECGPMHDRELYRQCVASFGVHYR